MSNLKNSRRPKSRSFLERKHRYGYLFVLPWIIGFILFFIQPFFQTILYSFFTLNDKLKPVSFTGLKNFNEALFSDPYFIRDITTVISEILIETPMIVIFSLFAANLIHKNFPGRSLVRLIFFLPIVYGTGFLIQLNTQYTTSSSYGMSAGGLMEFFTDTAGVFPGATIIVGFVDRLFDVITRSGVQILIFIAGINAIPISYYEASTIDGARGWSTFWLITFPVVSPFILMNTVYTFVDSFTLSTNPMIKVIYDSINKMQFSYGSTRAIIYFACIFVIITITSKLISRKIVQSGGEAQ